MSGRAAIEPGEGDTVNARPALGAAMMNRALWPLVAGFLNAQIVAAICPASSAFSFLSAFRSIIT